MKSSLRQEPHGWLACGCFFTKCPDRVKEWEKARLEVVALYLDQSSETVPEGWRLMPIEPTENMLDVYWRQSGESWEMRLRYHNYARRYYDNLLAAAPSYEE
jgi:hypothetical protein